MRIGRTRMLRPHDRRVGPGVAVAWMVLAATLAYVPAASASVVVQINVPADVATIQGAIDMASPGDMVRRGPRHLPRAHRLQGQGHRGAQLGRPVVDHHRRRRPVGGRQISHRRGPGVHPARLHDHRGVRYFSIFGAGVSIVKASPTIVGNVITGNYIDGSAGGGIGAYPGRHSSRTTTSSATTRPRSAPVAGSRPIGSAEILGNLIEGNVAGGGGGVLIADEVVLADNVIRDNHALTYHGGGVNIGSGSPRGGSEPHHREHGQLQGRRARTGRQSRADGRRLRSLPTTRSSATRRRMARRWEVRRRE